MFQIGTATTGIAKLALAGLAVLMSSGAFAAVVPETELNLQRIHELTQKFQAEQQIESQAWQPRNVSASDSATSAAQKILNQSAQNLFAESLSQIRLGELAVAQALNDIEVSTRSESHSAGAAEQPSESQANDVEFSVNPSRGLAALSYRGPVAARVEVQGINAQVSVRIEHKLGSQAQLLFEGAARGQEALQTIGLSMNW